MPNHSCLQWRCRRGTRELDLLLQTWLSREFEQSNADEQQAFVEMLEWPDDQLIHLLLGPKESDRLIVNTLARKIRTLSLHRP